MNKKKLEQEMSQLAVMRMICQAYAQIASIRSKRMKNSVLYSRDFIRAVTTIFQDVLLSYRQSAEALKIKRKGKQITFLAHNGRPVAVLLSANSRLYGDLIKRTFDLFIKEVSVNEVEITIIGAQGLALFKEAHLNRPYSYFSLPDTNIDKHALNQVIQHLVKYEEIRFFYPQFENAINQKPVLLRITAGTVLPDVMGRPRKKYLFEPNMEAILGFFETQIFSSLVDQTIQESQLAKFASRLLAMDTASERINEKIHTLHMTQMRAMHLLNDRKQAQLLSTRKLWRCR